MGGEKKAGGKARNLKPTTTADGVSPGQTYEQNRRCAPHIRPKKKICTAHDALVSSNPLISIDI